MNYCKRFLSTRDIHNRIKKILTFQIIIGCLQALFQVFFFGFDLHQLIKADEKNIDNSTPLSLYQLEQIGFNYTLEILNFSFSIWLKVFGGIISLVFINILKRRCQCSKKSVASTWTSTPQSQIQDNNSQNDGDQGWLKQLLQIFCFIFIFTIITESMMQSQIQQCGVVLGIYHIYLINQLKFIKVHKYCRIMIIILSQVYILMRRRFLYPKLSLLISIEYVMIQVFFILIICYSKEKDKSKLDNITRLNSLKYLKQTLFIRQSSIQNQNGDKSDKSKQQRLSIENNKVALSQSFGIVSDRKNTLQSPFKIQRLDLQSASFCGVQPVTASNFSKLAVNSNIHFDENQKLRKQDIEMIEQTENQLFQHLNYMQLIYDVLFKFFPEGILFLNKEKELIQCNDAVRDILQRQTDEDIASTFLNINIQEQTDTKQKGNNNTTQINSYAGTSVFTQGTQSTQQIQLRNSNRLIQNNENEIIINQSPNPSYLFQSQSKKQRKSYFESISNKRQEQEESKIDFNAKRIQQEQSYDDINIYGQECENGSFQSSQINREKNSTLAQQQFLNDTPQNSSNLSASITLRQQVDSMIEQTKNFIQQNPMVENIIFTEVQIFNIELDIKPLNNNNNGMNSQNQGIDAKSMGSQTMFQHDYQKTYYEIKCFQCIINKAPVILALIKDISYQKQISKLKTYASNKSQMVNFVSHELRTPLNCIIAMLDTCDIKNEKINNALLNSKYLLNLSNDLLDLAQIKAGKFKINQQKMNLQSVLGECVYLFEYRAQQQRVTLEYKFHENVPEYIISDPHRIKQVTINLLSNAFKFTLQGSISLEVSCISHFKRKLIQVSVHDSGIGIKKENLKLLFKAFGKEEEKRTTMNQQGVGLGLLISNLIAQQLSCPRTQTDYQSINDFKRSTTQLSQPQKQLQNCSQLMQGIQVSSEVEKGSTFSFYIDYMGCQPINDQSSYNINIYQANQFNDFTKQNLTQNCTGHTQDDENLILVEGDDNTDHPGFLYFNSPYAQITELGKINKFQINKSASSLTSNNSFNPSMLTLDYLELKQRKEKKAFPNAIIGEISIQDFKNNNLATFQHLEKNQNILNTTNNNQQNILDQSNINNNILQTKNASILNNIFSNSPQQSSQIISTNSISVQDLSTFHHQYKQSKQTYSRSSTCQFASSQKLKQITENTENHSQDDQKNNYFIKVSKPNYIQSTNTSQQKDISIVGQPEFRNFSSILQKDCKCSQILICDDNPFNLSALSTLLDKLHLKSDQILSGQQAEQLLLERLKNGKCCKTYLICFMDIEMPFQNGFQTSINIRNKLQKKQPLIVACSSYSNQSEKILAASYGMHNYLVKPILLENLTQFMNEICTSYCLQTIIKDQQS